MGDETPGSGARTATIEDRFDRILGRHMQRLLGTRNGIAGLPITIYTISCIILLASHIKNEQGGIGQPGPYTRAMLNEELTDLSLDPDEVMDSIIPAMIGRGYIEIHSDSGITIKDHTVKMALILDRVFPTMPGINLVAYLAQAMDEVKSRRKSLETAEDHLDQTLTIHGVMLQKTPAPARHNRASLPIKKEKLLKREVRPSPPETRRPARSRIIKGSDFDAAQQKAAAARKRQTLPHASPAPPGTSSPHEFSAEPASELVPGTMQSAETGETIPAAETDGEGRRVKPPEATSETEDHRTILSAAFSHDPSPGEEQALPQELQFDLPAVHRVSSSPSEPEIHEGIAPHPLSDMLIQEEDPDEDRELHGDGRNGLKPGEGPEHSLPGAVTLQGDDDSVERRVTAFAEDLAMQCPLCGKGKIRSQKTGTGKRYYVCSEKDCTFISWGRPYHLTCPECGNPFMIESSAGDGELILRCPRATCFHWQRHPSDASAHDTRRESPPRTSQGTATTPSRPRKKIVKRKVVRRKR